MLHMQVSYNRTMMQQQPLPALALRAAEVEATLSNSGQPPHDFWQRAAVHCPSHACAAWASNIFSGLVQGCAVSGWYEYPDQASVRMMLRPCMQVQRQR